MRKTRPENLRQLSFTVAITVPTVFSVYQIRDFITAAIMKYVPLRGIFTADRIVKLKVKRAGKEHSRASKTYTPLNTTQLIKHLQVIEEQFRLLGKMPPKMPLNIPVNISENFNPGRYGIGHITAKPGLGVLLHFIKDELDD